jgi:hypothetical protein
MESIVLTDSLRSCPQDSRCRNRDSIPAPLEYDTHTKCNQAIRKENFKRHISNVARNELILLLYISEEKCKLLN